MSLVITHTHAEGTLIEGTIKGDGTNVILKRHRWRWGRSIGVWYVPHSRDKNFQQHRVIATAQDLEAAGFSVDLDIDNTPRTTAEIEADTQARAEARTQALAVKAERKKAAAATARQAHHNALERLPYGGEPVKIGHHSERRHRNDLSRAHNALGKLVEADRDATAAEHKATAAQRAAQARYAPSTVASRLERLEVEARKIQRHLDGYTSHQGTPYAYEVPPATGAARDHWQAEATRIQGELDYWQEVRTEQVQTGQITEHSPETINPGDYVQTGRSGSWWRVKRVNKKTLTLESHGCSIRAAYRTITGHKAVTPDDASA